MKEAVEAHVNSSSLSCRDSWMQSRLQAARLWG